MMTATFGFNATSEEGKAVNYMSPSDCGGTYATKEKNKLRHMFGQGLLYALKSSQWYMVHHSRQRKKTIQPTASYSGSIPFFLMNQKYAHM
jgi:hypothetical protein